MSVPKSVTRVHRQNGVVVCEFTDSVNREQYLIHELTRAALRDVAKYVKRIFKDSYYRKFKKITGKAGKVTKSKVWSSQSTLYPRVDIGIKTGKADGFYAYFQEFGTKHPNKFGLYVPKLGLLQHAVKDNVDKIREIESQYLSYIENERKALSVINESETEDED